MAHTSNASCAATNSPPYTSVLIAIIAPDDCPIHPYALRDFWPYQTPFDTTNNLPWSDLTKLTTHLYGPTP